MAAEVVSDKKKKLLAIKESLIKEIRDNEARINEVLNSRTRAFNFQSDRQVFSESDDDYLDNCTLRMGPPMSQLKLEQEHLLTRLHATAELTGLKIVESEVNVLPGRPQLDNNLPTEEGTWKEVTAECRAENLRFTISFYCHQPACKFAPLTYHNLQVNPVKDFHAKELENSVLRGLDRPSDAVQVMRSYATACRSRRETLTQILETFSDYLSMSKLPKGGYLLKCPGVLELTWVLENKWSPIAAFHHSMCFEVENVDEVHIKKIKPAHKQIRDPTIDTEDRTMLLKKIIEVCVEAKIANGDIEAEYSENDLESNQREQDCGNERDYEVNQGNVDRAKYVQTSNKRESGKENIPTISKGKRHNPDAQSDTISKKIKGNKVIEGIKGNDEQGALKTKNPKKDNLQNKDNVEQTKLFISAGTKNKEAQKIENTNEKSALKNLTVEKNENVGQKKINVEALEAKETQKVARAKAKEKADLLSKDKNNKEMDEKTLNKNDRLIKQKQERVKEGENDNFVKNKKVKIVKNRIVNPGSADKELIDKIHRPIEKKNEVDVLIGKKEHNKAITKERNELANLRKDLLIKKKDMQIKKLNKKRSNELNTNSDTTYIINRNHGWKKFSNNVKSTPKETVSEKVGDDKEKKEKDDTSKKNEMQNQNSITKLKLVQKVDAPIKDLEKKKGIPSHEFKKPKPIIGKGIVDKKRLERENMSTDTRDKFFRNSNSIISKIPKSAKLPITKFNAIKHNKGIVSREKEFHNASKIPQRKSNTIDKFKDSQRTSPRFLKKPVAKSKTIFGAVK
ncbi:hypothetical protein EVAR_82036_1 [Eumeta japonica]|uniref:Uncharacterized protein n=1 Tax=Eumeta variegata TaxID=151549 RepID=A0A4C1XIG7_EUMVA|nr:hypothetical protein EVAR_82036_1 [Eumeta japonica]